MTYSRQTHIGDTHTGPFRLRAREAMPSAVSKLLSAVGKRLRTWGYSLPLYEIRLKGRHPLQLLASPKDPLPPSLDEGRSLLRGHIYFQNERLPFGRSLWKTADSASEDFFNYCHSFRWLSHLRDSEDPIQACQMAEQAIKDWISHGGDKFDAARWAPAVTGARIFNWLVGAPLVMSSQDLVYRSRLLNMIARQARHLLRTVADAPRGLPRLEAASGALLASIVLPVGTGWQPKAHQWMLAALDDFLLADGGPRSRNSADALKALRLLVILRDAYKRCDEPFPGALQSAIDRLVPFLKAMRHQNGMLGAFNGLARSSLFGLDSLLKAAAADGGAMEKLPHTGYQRLLASDTLLIIDSGPPPPEDMSHEAHVATGAFEMSSGLDPLVVSVGHVDDSEDYKTGSLSALCRTTAAHSAAVLNDRNSSVISDTGLIKAGVCDVRLKRDDYDAGTRISLWHDGYKKRLKSDVGRTLFLSRDGKTLLGQDDVSLFGRGKVPQLTVRFHLHPSCSVSMGLAGEARLETRSGHQWQVSSPDGSLTLESSLYIDRNGQVTPTSQLVLDAADKASLEWEWRRTK